MKYTPVHSNFANGGLAPKQDKTTKPAIQANMIPKGKGPQIPYQHKYKSTGLMDRMMVRVPKKTGQHKKQAGNNPNFGRVSADR